MRPNCLRHFCNDGTWSDLGVVKSRSELHPTCQHRAVLVGRDGLSRRILASLELDRPIVLVGEAGVGKTTLLRAAATASGRPFFEGGGLSTLSWMDNLPLRRALGRPVRAGDSSSVAADVERTVGAGVLLLDDLQWADRSTLSVTTILAGRVGLLTGVRSGDPGAEAALMRLRAAGFEAICVAPLDRSASEALVCSLRPDLTPSSVARLVTRTGGNPLLLRELAANDGEPSLTLRLELAGRLRQLDQKHKDAFAILALAARPVTIDELGADKAEALVDAGLAVLGDAGVQVRHALLAEVAVEQMTPQERADVHARTARLVTDPGEAARHHARAGEAGLAYASAMRAAQGAERHGERASHLALAAACVQGPAANELRLRAAWALEEAHDWDTMVTLLDQLDQPDAETRAEAALLRARGAWSAGDVDGLRAALSEGLALVEGTGSDVEVRLRIEQSRIPIFVDGDGAAALAMAGAALELATARNLEVPRAEYLYGTALWVAQAPGCSEHLLAAISAARAAGDATTEFLAANNLISFHEAGGDPAAGRELAVECIDRARERGWREWENSFGVAISELDFHAGNYAAVLHAADDLLVKPLDARGRMSLVEQQCLVLIDLGRFEEAQRRLEAESTHMSRDPKSHMLATWVRAEAALWGGEPQRAIELTEELLGLPFADMNQPFAYVSHAWALLELGEDPGPPVPAQELPILRAVPLEVAGVRLLFEGAAGQAAELFDQAAATWAPYHRRGELRCRWAGGEAVRRSGDLPDAVRRLEAVEGLLAARGMFPLLRRVHRSLRAAGVRRTTAPHREPRGWLSASERAVLACVGEGLTNAQIALRLGVSRHTVVSQITSASTKLGASNRSQAVVLATQRRRAVG